MIINDNICVKGGGHLPGRIPNLREDLILAGIQEINSHGISGFSIRRVAEACNVSCAAPYRHFKDKNALIGAIIDYVNEQWAKRQDEVLAQCGPSLREQMVEICVNYIRFLMEKPKTPDFPPDHVRRGVPLRCRRIRVLRRNYGTYPLYL